MHTREPVTVTIPTRAFATVGRNYDGDVIAVGRVDARVDNESMFWSGPTLHIFWSYEDDHPKYAGCTEVEAEIALGYPEPGGICIPDADLVRRLWEL